jgi:hypothetical protein
MSPAGRAWASPLACRRPAGFAPHTPAKILCQGDKRQIEGIPPPQSAPSWAPFSRRVLCALVRSTDVSENSLRREMLFDTLDTLDS